MIPCHQCSKGVPIGSALLTQDLEAKPLAFCSDVCHGLWSDDLLVPPENANSEAESLERTKRIGEIRDAILGHFYDLVPQIVFSALHKNS
jgi:hypothetical protein